MIETCYVRIADREYEVKLNIDSVSVNGSFIALDHIEFDDPAVKYNSDGRGGVLILDRSEEQSYLIVKGREIPVTIETSRDRLLKNAAKASGSGVHHAEIKAAMPGLVVRIHARVGDTVKKGDAVMILEAMKMENEVRAPVDGVIGEIHAVERGSVEKGDVLVVFE